MTFGIEFPEEIARELERKWGDVATRAREAIAIEGYRSGALSEKQVQDLLELKSRWETDAVLKQARAYLDYTEEDLLKDLETSRAQSAG